MIKEKDLKRIKENINFDNLSENMVIKNYKELCKIVDWKPTTGASKKSQFKFLDCVCKWHKEGQKIFIDEIYSEDDMNKKVDNRSGHNNIDYIKYIEALVLNYLAEKEDGVIFLSKYVLLNKLKMINDNYSFCKGRIDKLSKFSEIDTDNIYEFYASTDKTLIGNLEKALNNLKNKSLIDWSKEKTICECVNNKETFNIEDEISIDEFGEETHTYKNRLDLNYRKATFKEVHTILYIEKEVMKQMKRKDKKDVVAHGEWKQFKKIVCDVLKDYNIIFYYDSYRILFNQEHICEELIDICNYLLLDKEIKHNENTLNKEIIERLKNNAINRREKALNNKTNKNTKRRVSDTYLEYQNKLIDMLIHKDSKNIRHKVKSIKLKED